MKMKQTEIGLIPDDWEVKTLGEVVTFLDSKRIPITESERKKGIYPYYGASGIIDYVNNYIFDGDYVLLGEDGANIVDRSSRLAFVVHGKCWINNHAHVLHPNEDMDLDFLSEYLESLDYTSYNTGTAQPKLNREKCNSIPVIKPSLAEQQRIAKALSDVNALISTTEKLIQKKKNIKQGAMQNLLTGKKRLPGFCPQSKSPTYKQTELGLIPEDWEVKSLGEMVKIGHGRDYKNLKSGDVPVYGTGGYMTSVNDFLYEGETVCIGRKGTIDKPQYHSGKIWTVDTLFYTYDFKSLNPKYLFYKFCLIDWLSMNEASGVPSLTAKNIEDILIALPPEEEQTAIANVLSSMDKEIETLNIKLEKYRNLKTAMMQQLLTGKIRLI